MRYGAVSFAVHQVVETNHCTVRAQGLEAFLSVGLADTQVRNVARLVILNLNGGVFTSAVSVTLALHARTSRPEVRSSSTSRSSRTVLPAVLIEVHLQSSHEVLLANPRHHLTQHRSALRVRNAVGIHLNIGKVTNLSHNGVSRRQLILTVRPGLLRCGEGSPRLFA